MRVDNLSGIRNLCDVAIHLISNMPVNAATKFAVRTVLREAVNKSNHEYKGNNNRRNCRYISVSAAPLRNDPNSELVADHAIPISLLLKEVYAQPKITLDNLIELVGKYAVMVLITDTEDDALASAGLVKKMPIDWDGKDLLARYKSVGIAVNPNDEFSVLKS